MKRGAPDNSSNYSNDDNSNDNLPNQKLRILDNETQGMINFLPQELIGRILNLLDIATLMNASQVNKTWQGLIRQMAKDWISLYFPYLSTTQPQACQDTPLKRFAEECKKYRNILKDYPKITLELAMEALRGSKEVIDAANLDKNSKTYLYALLISNNHHLPKDFSPAEITLSEINNQALKIAAQNGHLAIAEALLAAGNISDDDMGTALVNAAQNGHLDVAKLLLAAGNISDDDMGTALVNAAQNGHLDVTRLLLAEGNISDDDMGTALVNAAGNGHLDVTRLLLAGGNIMDDDDDKGWALRNAARNGHLAIAEALLKSGGISSTDKGKALKFALEHNHTTIAEAIAENIASPSLLPNELAPTTPAIIQAAPTYTPLQMMGNGIDNAQPNNDPASTNTTEERASNASSLSHS